jgi:hypothetical protein
MNSRPDDRKILTLVNTTKTSSKKRKRQRNITTCKKSYFVARNRTLLQEIDQELPGHRIRYTEGRLLGFSYDFPMIQLL